MSIASDLFDLATLPSRALATASLGGTAYLRSLLFPPAPPTTGLSEPFVPPFTGGQCSGVNYYVTYVWVNSSTGNTQARQFYGLGKIGALYQQNGTWFFTMNGVPKDIVSVAGASGSPYLRPGDGIVIEGGGSDNCGDIQGTNPSSSPSGDGSAYSPPPNIDGGGTGGSGNGIKLIQGSPIVLIPDFLGAFNAALSLAKNATDALAAIKAIADAISSLKDLFDKLKDALDGKDKDKEDEAKSVYRYDFGSIVGDGYLRLYPDANTNKLRCSYIDVNIIQIPPTMGKRFGRFSPHRYVYDQVGNRFGSLGYISIVSPTFGVMKTVELEFRRISIECPPDGYGFFYHLGLNNQVSGNVSAFYVKREKTA